MSGLKDFTQDVEREKASDVCLDSTSCILSKALKLMGQEHTRGEKKKKKKKKERKEKELFTDDGKVQSTENMNINV